MKYLFEACVENYSQGKRAEEYGANRIELCDNLTQGGTTPSYGTIVLAKKNINIDINVIIRPRGGDFVYTEDEFEIMKKDIQVCKEIGINGVVFGILNKDNTLDFNRVKELVELARPLSVTFHMAFDKIKDKKQAMDKLISLEIDRILTTGGDISAFNNIESLKTLVNYADNRIIILPGGGITKDNYLELEKNIKFKEFHGTKIVGKL